MNILASCLTRALPIALTVVAVAAPAQAAPAWISPEEGAERTSHSQESPIVGIDAAGTVVSAWTRFDPDAGHRVVEARIRPAGGPPGAIAQLSDGAAEAGSVRLAVAADGRAVVAWAQAGVIRAAVRPPGGAFGAATTFPQEGGEQSFGVDLGLDGAGNARVLWASTTAGVSRIRTATLPVGGDPSGPQTVRQDAAAQLQRPALAVDPTGRAHAVWIRSLMSPPNRTTTIQCAYRPAGGAFAYAGDFESKLEAPFSNEAPAGLDAPEVVVDAGGGAVATWFRPGTPNAIRWSAGGAGAFSAPASLPGSEPAGGSHLAMSPAGEALVAATTMTVSRPVRVYRRPPGGTFGAPLEISAPEALAVTDVAMGSGGEAVVTWIRLVGGLNRARAAYHPGGTAAWAPTDLSADTPSLYSGTLWASAALDAEGNAALAWSQGGIGTFRQAIGGYDAASPRLGSLGVPATVERGVAFTVTGSAFDVWSVPTLDWRFDGGAPKPGPAAIHSFARIGRYPVAASAADALGNVTTATREVTVVDTRRPRLGRVRMTRKRFAVAKRGRARAAAAVRRGSAFRFSLGERARVTIRIDRVVRGHRRGGRCRPGAGAGRSCKLHRRASRTLTRRNRQTGANRVRFTGRIGAKALRPGRYRATLRAIDPAGNRSAARRVGFRIVRG